MGHKLSAKQRSVLLAMLALLDELSALIRELLG